MAVVRLIFRPCVGNHPMAPERMSFRFVARNHPSVTFGDSANSAPSPLSLRDISPPRGESPLKGSHRKHKVRYWRPLRGAPAKAGEGWFPVQDLKINRARPVNGPMASIGPYK